VLVPCLLPPSNRFQFVELNPWNSDAASAAAARLVDAWRRDEPELSWTVRTPVGSVSDDPLGVRLRTTELDASQSTCSIETWLTTGACHKQIQLNPEGTVVRLVLSHPCKCAVALQRGEAAAPGVCERRGEQLRSVAEHWHCGLFRKRTRRTVRYVTRALTVVDGVLLGAV
jgi:hypothetical protein